MQISLAKLGLWSLIVVVIATVVFAVLQPLIWDLLDRTPPTTTTDLGNLLAVMVAVVGLARIHRRTRMDGVRTAEGGG